MNDFKTYISVVNTQNNQYINEGKSFAFDKVLLSSNITYKDSVFTISQSGLYLANWRINMNTGDLSSDQIMYAVSLMKGGTHILNSGIGTGRAYGLVAQSGMVCLSAGDQLELVNNSTFTAVIINNGGTSAAFSLIRLC